MAKLGPKVKDEVLVQKVALNLTKRGIRPPCRVNVSVRNGVVTLSGTLQYELQRKTAIKAAQEVPGVQRVIDQLQVPKQTAAWHDFDKFRAKPKHGGGPT
jgi:osmotically-inducible protein OsmY